MNQLPAEVFVLNSHWMIWAPYIGWVYVIQILGPLTGVKGNRGCEAKQLMIDSQTGVIRKIHRNSFISLDLDPRDVCTPISKAQFNCIWNLTDGFVYGVP